MTDHWRRQKYRCTHLDTQEDGTLVCSLDLCDEDDVFVCCAPCPEYRGPDRGLGDTIKRATDAVGVKPCGGCQRRRESLNKLTEKLYMRGRKK